MTDAGELEALVSHRDWPAMKANDAERTDHPAPDQERAQKPSNRQARTPSNPGRKRAGAGHDEIKQRRDSIEQFAKGNRPDLVAKEQGRKSWSSRSSRPKHWTRPSRVVSENVISGRIARPQADDEGMVVMKAVQAKLQAAGLRARRAWPPGAGERPLQACSHGT